VIISGKENDDEDSADSEDEGKINACTTTVNFLAIVELNIIKPNHEIRFLIIASQSFFKIIKTISWYRKNT
jgi:hypothetical protein